VFGQLLVDFLFRLTLGIATAMALTPSRLVTSGFFRVHLWVLMGLQTLAALCAYSSRQSGETAAHYEPDKVFAAALGAAVLSYIGSVVWMYEKRRAGKVLISAVAWCSLAGGWWSMHALGPPAIARVVDFLTSSLLLGLVTTAMLLGHWYLNTPTMRLKPLLRLLVFLAGAIMLRMLVSGGGACLLFASQGHPSIPGTTLALFLTLRWAAGLAGVLALTWLTWQTLKIPNTQSATGILYAAVILALIGELTSQLLSAQTGYPV
jgi:hypothetical protein